MAAWWLAAAIGCADRTPIGDSGTTPPTTDTGTPPPPPVDDIVASCAPTDNALRFSCAVAVDPPQPVQISFVRADGDGRTRVHTSEQPLAEHTVPLYFLTPDTDYDWTASGLNDGAVATGTLHTGDLDSSVLSELEVVGASSVPYIGTPDPCDNAPRALIYDTELGEIVWYELLDDAGSFGFLNMLRFTEDHTVLGETGAAVVERDLTGAERFRLELPEDYDANLHHDLFRRDGYTYLIFQDSGAPTLDGLMVYDADETLVATWSARDHLMLPPGAAGDWMHTNTVWVGEDRSIYLSSYEQNSILKIRGDWEAQDFGQLEWVLAGEPPNGLGQDFAVDWSAVAPEGFGHQHDVQRGPDGSFVFLDNPRGRVLVVDVDEGARTAAVRGEYATASFACGPQGSAGMSSTGDVFAACSGAVLREYAPSGDLVWEGDVNCGGGLENSVRFYPLEGW